MSNHGRGKGKGGLSKAVLEQLSLSKSDLGKDPYICPPETFPALTYHPVKSTMERSLGKTYMLMVKKEHQEHFQNSEYYISLDSKKPDIEKYSDRFHCLNNNKPRLHLDWSRFPKELWTEDQSSASKKKSSKKLQAKVNIKRARSSQVKDLDIKEKLEELEKKETTGEDGEKKNEDQDENLIEDEEDVDEEMDEGTDYINSYFDNGETYIDDEGDGLEEGGVF